MPSVSDQFTVSSSHSHERLSRPVSHRQLRVPLFHTRGSSHIPASCPYIVVHCSVCMGCKRRKKEVGGRRARQDHRTEPKSIHKWSTPMKRTENKPLKKQDFLKLIAYTCTCVYVYFTNSQSQCKMRLHETCKLLRFREKVAGSVLLSE